MSGFIDKVSNFFFKDVDDTTEDTTEQTSGARSNTAQLPDRGIWQENSDRKKNKPNLVSVPGKGGVKDMEMVLIKAVSYDDMQEIANHLKSRKVAVVNFEEMDKDVAQRMVDFLSGATFALDGVPRKVSGATFIFSSSNVDLSGHIMDKDGSLTDFSRDERFSSTQWLRK